MTDFKKEELELLVGCCFCKWVNSFVDPSIYHLKDDCKKLGDKIQSMIDNYQEECDKSWPSNMINPCPECKRYHDE